TWHGSDPCGRCSRPCFEPPARHRGPALLERSVRPVRPASFATRALGVLTIPVITVPAIAGGAEAATAPAVPKPPTKTLPSALDIAPPYIGQKLCDPTA